MPASELYYEDESTTAGDGAGSVSIHYSRGPGFFSLGYKHRIADPPSPAQYCDHGLLVRWRYPTRGITWQVQR